MARRFISLAPRLLVAAGCVMGAVAAHAAQGYWVTQQQQAMVSPGMSMEQVHQVLGQPGRTTHYPNEPGPTYTYQVLGQPEHLFDVDFGTDGLVKSSNERMDLSGGGGHGHSGGGDGVQ